MKLVNIILSGGSGTRLWPLSREKCPKQLLSLFNDKTMLQETINRVNTYYDHSTVETMVVSNREYRFLIAEQLKQIGIKANIILEPFGRNTAPALTLAAFEILKDNSDAVMLVMPADHLIQDVAEFNISIEKGYLEAKKGSVICFGIEPTRADIGYGYIKTETKANSTLRILNTFVEKPSYEVAEEYLREGSYVWNSGIFMLKASTWINCISRLNKDIYNFCEKSMNLAEYDKDFIWIDGSSFEKCPSDSIDYAVMEHVGKDNKLNINSYVIPINVGWSDVGSWDSVWESSKKDQNGNSDNVGEYGFYKESSNNLVVSDKSKVVTLLGMEDTVVIDTPDALLIAKKNNLSNIKNLVSEIKKKHPKITELGRKVSRPWGCYDSIDNGNNFQVKKIVVNPGGVLSLQMHHHRAEHWIIVKGTAKITKDKKTFLLHENQSVYIPLGIQHRLENPGKLPLELIEVQSGSYLGEDDIVRFDDVYGRKE
ncbi:mannose-1-phosphate guanylyltransferase/mannose-6-phosphate isomerase [Acinetobacter ursingii]|uniref:mannose-1-phosphate guanylyltransferase/mannose-6-phosphate isomerase n=1 Tax=Acinetobacter ursingii TaxID=108980 RepID=UPI003AF832C7